MEKTQHTLRYGRLLAALRHARHQAGLTQLDVARRPGTYASYVSRCESGERRVDVIELAQFCRVHGVTLAAILEHAGLCRAGPTRTARDRADPPRGRSPHPQTGPSGPPLARRRSQLANPDGRPKSENFPGPYLCLGVNDLPPAG
jgi:transcriptional regulator with XRE-family HTH domain